MVNSLFSSSSFLLSRYQTFAAKKKKNQKYNNNNDDNNFEMEKTKYATLVKCLVLLLNLIFLFLFRRAILGNPDVLHSTPWKHIVHNDFWGTPLIDSGSHGSYRPLCVLTFKLNHLFGGFKPIGYHLVNVLLHCLATGLVVKVARLLLPPLWGPAVAGALFASHPIHTEAVAGIVGRADLAACNFYLLTFLTYSKHVVWREQNDAKSWGALVGSIMLSVAAVLCKETAVTALVLCALFDIIRGMNGYADKVIFKFIEFSDI